MRLFVDEISPAVCRSGNSAFLCGSLWSVGHRLRSPHRAARLLQCHADSGPVVGQAFAITLAPNLAVIGESLNYGQIGQSLSATTADCKGNTVSRQQVHLLHART